MTSLQKQNVETKLFQPDTEIIMFPLLFQACLFTEKGHGQQAHAALCTLHISYSKVVPLCFQVVNWGAKGTNESEPNHRRWCSIQV